MVCLWDIPADSSPVTTADNIKGILEEQARYLEAGTNGKVMADLNEIDEIPAEIPRPSRVFSISSPCKGKEQQHSIKRGKFANQYIIQSDEDFVNCLSIVLSCRKVRFIIDRLLELYGGFQ